MFLSYVRCTNYEYCRNWSHWYDREQKSTKTTIKKGPESPIYITNKYNFCVCTIYSYHIMHNIVIHAV